MAVRFFQVTGENQLPDEVPYTFFPQRTDCKVTLYQDADVSDSFVPKILLANGSYCAPQRCWEDIFDAITKAKNFVYISGWSVYTKITLVRNTTRHDESCTGMTLGELLKKKSDEGVQVLILIWNDAWGTMGTYCKETKRAFKNTGVQCVLCSRDDVAFSHHQKTIVVDNDGKIVSFLGGLDLCHGRYDTQDHSLFKTLSTTHKDDFYQGNFEDVLINHGGPRQPWHDVHCRLEGPAAWDVLQNFVQRWEKEGFKLKEKQFKSKLIPSCPVTFDSNQETWNVQVFRSIDAEAAKFPDDLEQGARGLVSGNGGVIERSIQDAYVHAIRKAKRFIYIENQYFIGSSFDRQSLNSEALNLIPKELTLKIVSKIKEGKRFTVYVVIPMRPEGDTRNVFPGISVPAMLDMQKKTMEMMYTNVIHALKVERIKASKAEDYLSFFCLGNREVKPGECEPSESLRSDDDYSKAREKGRFMIYVHSKMMIGNS